MRITEALFYLSSLILLYKSCSTFHIRSCSLRRGVLWQMSGRYLHECYKTVRLYIRIEYKENSYKHRPVIYIVYRCSCWYGAGVYLLDYVDYTAAVYTLRTTFHIVYNKVHHEREREGGGKQILNLAEEARLNKPQHSSFIFLLSTDKNKKKGYTQGQRALFHSWSMPRVLKKFSYVKCRHVYSTLTTQARQL